MLPSQALKKYGWVQNRLGNPTDGFCMVGALTHVSVHPSSYAYTPEDIGWLTYTVMRDRIELQIPDFIDWNNTPGRTAEEVIAFLESIQL